MSVRLQHIDVLVRDACRQSDYLRFDRAFDWWVSATEFTAEAIATEGGGALSKVRCIPVSALGERFWAWVIQTTTGEREWREYNRATLLDELVIAALRQYYGPLQRERKRGTCYGAPHALVVDPGFRLLEMVKRIAVSGGVTPSEFVAIKHEWRAWWEKHGPSVRLARTTDAVHRHDLPSAVGAPVIRG